MAQRGHSRLQRSRKSAGPQRGGPLRNYELVLMLDPEVDDDRVGAVMDRIRRLVGDHAGEIVDEENWGKRKLAYKIGNYTEANYHLAHLSMEGEGSKALENGLKLADDVIRHLLVRQDD
jgi:small subunit ribosomal protein S6